MSLTAKVQPRRTASATRALALPDVRSIRSIPILAPATLHNVHVLVVVGAREIGHSNYNLAVPVPIALLGGITRTTRPDGPIGTKVLHDSATFAVSIDQLNDYLRLFGRCVSAEAAADLAALLDFGFRNTLEAADAAL